MFGLAMLFACFVYLVVCLGAIIFAVKLAEKAGRSPILWGILTGLLMYNLIFWDFLPTLAVFKYKCQTESGFWVYKTPEQWKKENPGVAETLTWNERSQPYVLPGIIYGKKLNERIGWIIIEHHTQILPVIIQEELIIDIENNKTLVKRVSIYSGRGRPNDVRFWLTHKQLGIKKEEFSALMDSYKKLGNEIK